jgi:antitoxin component YwqK of YwqJK toxin-antitoxin module
MKYCVLLITYIFFSTPLFSQDESPCGNNIHKCDFRNIKNCYSLLSFDDLRNMYVMKHDFATPYTGTCATCHQNGNLEESLNIIDGFRDGIDTSYFSNGCRQSIQSYDMGKLNGKSTVFYESGKKEREINHLSNLLQGRYILFEDNERNDTIELHTYKNNLLDGVQKFYYRESKLGKMVYYKAGLQDGPHITYTDSGKVEMRLNYKQGKKDGKWTYFYESGKEAHVENWSIGFKNGEFKTMDEKGMLLQQAFFQNNLPIGKHVEYYPDGKLKYQATYTSKSEKLEEFSIDQFGVKTELFKKIEKSKKGEPKKAAEVSDEKSEGN